MAGSTNCGLYATKLIGLNPYQLKGKTRNGNFSIKVSHTNAWLTPLTLGCILV